MSREWKPGDVAMVTPALGGKLIPDQWPAAWDGKGWNSLNPYIGFASPSEVSAARPLLLIDPEDRDDAARVLGAWFGHKAATYSEVERMQTALRGLAALKPEEPTGLGAVVEDADGHWWSRLGGTTDSPWHHGTQGRSPYSCIAAVKVLSEGVPQ